MALYRVAKFWFEVEASSSDEAATVAEGLVPSAEWVAPDPSKRYAASVDPLLEEARWLLSEWAIIGSDPGHLTEASQAISTALGQRLMEASAAEETR